MLSQYSPPVHAETEEEKENRYQGFWKALKTIDEDLQEIKLLTTSNYQKSIDQYQGEPKENMPCVNVVFSYSGPQDIFNALHNLQAKHLGMSTVQAWGNYAKRFTADPSAAASFLSSLSFFYISSKITAHSAPLSLSYDLVDHPEQVSILTR